MTARYAILLAAALGLAPTAHAQFTPTPQTNTSGSGYYGAAVVPIGDLDGNGVGDYAIGAPYTAVGGEAEAGTVRIQFMTTPTTAGATVDLNPGGLLTSDNFGAALAVLSPAPALRLLVGTPGFYGGGDSVAESGQVYVLTINAAGAITAQDVINDLDVPGLNEGDRFGSSIAVLQTAPVAVFAIGMPGANCTAGVDCGAVSVVTYAGVAAAQIGRFGGAGGPGVTQTLAGLAAGDRFGTGLAVNGSDVFVGAPFADAGGPNRGRVYATTVDLLGNFSTPVVLDGSSPLLASLPDGAEFGYSLATPLAGATYHPTVVAGAPGTNSATGGTWVLAYAGGAWTGVSQGAAPAAPERSGGGVVPTSASATASASSMPPGGRYGQGLALPGRAPGYGTIDLLVGAPGSGGVTYNEVSGAILPVELVAFEAVANGARLTLRWTTASETNNAGFTVEARSAQAAGGAWRDLGRVDGAGTTTERQTYTFDVPVSLTPGRYTFRLTQRDTDGAAHPGATVEGVVGMDTPVLLAASPNPAREGVRITAAVREAQEVQVAVYDLLGREAIRLFDGDLAAAEAQTWAVAPGTLAPGRYFLRLTGARGARLTQPLVVVR